eukprot:GHVS01083090.1.p1 GENE.GHVS01083090.1~~GHVS01083090.1.p1  ORF type:complete len:157 (+),score=23.73 GHVS01083090.1:846-1316(+)
MFGMIQDMLVPDDPHCLSWPDVKRADITDIDFMVGHKTISETDDLPAKTEDDLPDDVASHRVAFRAAVTDKNGHKYISGSLILVARVAHIDGQDGLGGCVTLHFNSNTISPLFEFYPAQRTYDITDGSSKFLERLMKYAMKAKMTMQMRIQVAVSD